jgi:hypothetical protein
MRPAETFEYGTTLHPTQGGYRIRRPDRHSYGRVFVRLVDGQYAKWWRARCDAWDGFSWSQDKILARPTIAELEEAVREYVAGLDRKAHACSLPN